jgi:hypothetical protein
MTSPTRIAALRYAMIATGIIFIGGLYTLSRVRPSDVPALLLVAGALATLTRRATAKTAVTDLGVRRAA